MHKKLLAKLLVLALLTVLSLGAVAPMVLAEEPVTLTYWFPHGGAVDRGSLEKSIEQFNAANPDIVVVGEFIGGSGTGVGLTDKLTVAINGGTPPDVVLFDRFQVGQWAGEGLFTDLTDYMEASGITADLFFPFAWEEASLNGRQYALPFDTDNRMLFYNKTHFAAAGLDPDSPPLTIAELEEYAEKLTIADGPRVMQYGFVPWYSQGWLYTWGWAFGGLFQDDDGKITASDPKIIEALQWEVDFAQKYGYENMESFTTAAGGDNLNPFSAGLLSMFVSGPWEIAGLKANAPDIDFEVSYIPTPTGDNFNSWAGGWSHIIPTGVTHVEEAMRFAAFMSVGEGAFNYGEDTAHFMCAVELNDTFSWVKEEPRFEKFIEVFPASFCRPVISKGMLLWDELANAVNLALAGEGNPADLLEKVDAKVNAELGL